MVDTPFFRCPDCGSVETPTLVVRGSGLRNTGLTLKCRECGSERPDSRTALQAS
jgi:predicted RNA-binding Zn-ribbon protein involved in translation (DUF1610 family)